MLRDHVPNVRGVWINAGECSFQRAIDFDPRVCHAFPITSLIQTVSGMISACAGRAKSVFLSITEETKR